MIVSKCRQQTTTAGVTVDNPRVAAFVEGIYALQSTELVRGLIERGESMLLLRRHRKASIPHRQRLEHMATQKLIESLS